LKRNLSRGPTVEGAARRHPARRPINRQFIHSVRSEQAAPKGVPFAAGFSVFRPVVGHFLGNRQRPILFPRRSASMVSTAQLGASATEHSRRFFLPNESEVAMTRFAEAAAREAKIVELKRLITARRYETMEKLEDAVDAFLWSEQDRLQKELDEGTREIARAHPK
jgi:hypothetical protein